LNTTLNRTPLSSSPSFPYTKTMPSQILHTLFGEDLLDALCSRPELSALGMSCQGQWQDRWDRVCRGAFAVGCQGPDIFYHSRNTRPLALEYGSLLHRRGFGTFCAQLLKLALPTKAIPPWNLNAHAAYALGFLSHAALDRGCHPYIIYKSATMNARGEENSLFHPFFERILDTLMLRELRGMETGDWDQGLLAETCGQPLGLKELVASAMITAFPEKVAGDQKLAGRMDSAFADSARFYRLTDPAKTFAETLDAPPSLNRRYLSVVYPLELPRDVDFLNTNREPWYYPYRPPSPCVPETPDTRSFQEVYADTLKTAVDAILPCMVRYMETGTFPLEVAAHIGNGSLSIHDGEGKPCAPNFSSPLPLATVLEHQAKLRATLVPPPSP